MRKRICPVGNIMAIISKKVWILPSNYTVSSQKSIKKNIALKNSPS